MFHVLGILSGSVTHKIGPMITGILGCLLSTVGLVTSAFATSIVQLYFSLGIILGIYQVGKFI